MIILLASCSRKQDISVTTTYVVDKNGNIVGEPIVGAITEKNQAKTLEKLIDQALQVK